MVPLGEYRETNGKCWHKHIKDIKREMKNGIFYLIVSSDLLDKSLTGISKTRSDRGGGGGDSAPPLNSAPIHPNSTKFCMSKHNIIERLREKFQVFWLKMTS